MVAGPIVGVEGGVAEVLDQIAMEVECAALGDETDLPAGGSAVLGVVVCGQDLHFLNGIDIQRSEHGTGRSSACGDRAVDHDDVLVRAATVNAEAAVRYAVGIEGADRAARNARLQEREIDRIAAVQGEVLDLSGIDNAANLGAFGLHKPGISADTL